MGDGDVIQVYSVNGYMGILCFFCFSSCLIQSVVFGYRFIIFTSPQYHGSCPSTRPQLVQNVNKNYFTHPFIPLPGTLILLTADDSDASQHFVRTICSFQQDSSLCNTVLLLTSLFTQHLPFYWLSSGLFCEAMSIKNLL